MKQNKKKENKNETIKNLKRAWRFIGKERGQLLIYLITNILVCIISIIVPALAAKRIIYLTNNQLSQLILIGLLIFGIEIFRNIVNFFSRTSIRRVWIGTLTEVQFNLSEEILKLETKELDKTSSGVFADRLTKDPYDISNIFSRLTSTITQILTSVGVLVAIFIVNKILFVYIITFITIRYFLQQTRIKKRYAFDKERRKISEKNTGLITELVRGSKDIKALNIGNSFLTKMKTKIVEANEKQVAMEDVTIRYQFLIGCIYDAEDLGFTLLNVLLLMKNLLTIPNAIVISQYRLTAENFLYYLTDLTEQLKVFNVSANRIFEIIESEKYSKEKFGKKNIGRIEGNFEFKHVNFSYDKKNKVIKDMSFKINPNETVAFVGKSGGGKSTVFSLLNKMYTVDSGEILIEGININELDKESIRDNMTIITQNPYIFNFSIKENLKIVKPNATMKEIKNACKVACLDKFIESLPDKYNTLVGEGGVTLSGGQRQRLSIARALLKDTEIILFDEATSALDNETQSQIQEAIRNMKGEYTILIIAHRLSTVMDADRIMVVEDGKITAQGTQKELMKKSKLFKELYSKELNE